MNHYVSLLSRGGLYFGTPKKLKVDLYVIIKDAECLNNTALKDGWRVAGRKKAEQKSSSLVDNKIRGKMLPLSLM